MRRPPAARDRAAGGIPVELYVLAYRLAAAVAVSAALFGDRWRVSSGGGTISPTSAASPGVTSRPCYACSGSGAFFDPDIQT